MMKLGKLKNGRVSLVLIVLAGAISLLPSAVSQEDKKQEKKLQYVGVAACKNCHSAKALGNQFGKWKETKMSKSFESLATDKAKEFAKKHGIDDPQKSEKCLKCHTTAFGIDEKLLGKKFDKKDGVQCEACHGPAEVHVKNRLAGVSNEEDEETQHKNALKEMPPPDHKVCANCHNGTQLEGHPEDPFWNKEKKEFDFEGAFKKVSHYNPKWHKEEKEK